MYKHNPGVTDHGAYDPDALIVGDHDVFTMKVTMLSGEVRTRGALLGKITTGGKFKLSTSGASDGSQLMSTAAILLEDCDATAGDTTCLVALAGGFAASKLTLGASHTAATIKEALALRGVYLYEDYAIDG